MIRLGLPDRLLLVAVCQTLFALGFCWAWRS
jgi:hypothetical protein